MGHLTSISVTLLNAATTNTNIDKALVAHAEWNKYVKGPLAATRDRENKIIGGYMPAGTFCSERESV
jgi:hypothetical protein